MKKLPEKYAHLQEYVISTYVVEYDGRRARRWLLRFEDGAEGAIVEFEDE